MRFHEHREIKEIRAGDIVRHPKHEAGPGRIQRTSPLPHFLQRFGPFDKVQCVELIHVVKAPKQGYFAIDGATRVEACMDNPDYGPDTKLECRLYGNGRPPTDQELADLYLIINTHRISTSSAIQLGIAVTAERPDALHSETLRARLGPKFRSSVGLWNIVKQHGDEVGLRAVQFVEDTWLKRHHMPMALLKGVAVIMTRSADDIAQLNRRMKRLRTKTPDNWVVDAQMARMRQIGRRDDATVWMMRTLLGRDPSPARRKKR